MKTFKLELSEEDVGEMLAAIKVAFNAPGAVTSGFSGRMKKLDATIAKQVGWEANPTLK